MGVSYYATVVFGVAFRSERREVRVTRYHEVTGEPYQKPVVEWAMVPAERKIATTFPQPQENEHYDEWYDTLRHGGDGSGVIGILIKSADPVYDEAEPLDIPNLDELAEQLRAKLSLHYSPQEVGWFMTHARLYLNAYGH